MNKKILAVYASIAIAGGMAIFTLPFRGSEPIPKAGLSTEPCTLDLEVERIEEEIESRKAVLDSMLESAVLVRETSMIRTEVETTESATEEAETETTEEIITEAETSASEAISEAVEVFEPVASMMPADLQAWVYAYSTQEGVDPYIIMAICERESCCISNIFGDGGRAWGMMQIHTVWVRDKMAAHGYSDADMLMAEPNITIGVEILQGYIEQGHGIEWALMAYNGGPSMAGTPATQEYAAWVMNRADELRN
jgi:soluble lytic murein transglycosylase-like protein